MKNGLNPSDLPIVVDALDGNQNFIVVEGNRRLTAINLLLKPEMAEGTGIHASFKKLNRLYSDAIPKVLECVIVTSKQAGLIWINRKHASGMEGAGTEPWSAMAKARADEEQGIPRPDLDAVNFVLTNPKLDEPLRKTLEGSSFPITTLRRLVESKEMQLSTGFSLQGSRYISEQDKDRVRGILTDAVTVIATGKYKGEKFTERQIDSLEKREEFVGEITAKHPPRKRTSKPWVISGTPVHLRATAKPRRKGTLSTEDQPNLIPKSFRMELPSGKINDVFTELKTLDVVRYRHAVSVLFRLFFEFTLDDYIKKHQIVLPTDKHGHTIDKLQVRLQFVKKHAKDSKLMTEKELQPLKVAIGSSSSILAPDTLNAYVHSVWMNPDPLLLKLTWANLQLFIERSWGSKNTAGHP